MEHSLSPFDLPQPWRTRAIVAAAVAVVELFLLLTVALAAARPAPVVPSKAEKAPKPKPPVRPVLARGETSVLVLNGSGATGAAASQAEVVRARGYMIGGVGNAPHNDFTRSTIMYRPGYKREAARLARDTGIPYVSALDGLTRRDLLGAHLALVIGAS